MLQNIHLLNSVRNNVGLALNVALVADHRTNSRVETVQVGKRPCDEAVSDRNPASDRARATLRADAVDAGFGRPAAFAAFTEAERASAGIEGAIEGGSGLEGAHLEGTGAAATARAYSPRKKPQQASIPAKQRGSKMPAAIWASLVLSRV